MAILISKSGETEELLPLLEQLKPNGIIVGPVGNQYEQEMVKGIKRKDGKMDIEFLGQFLFTPMYGRYGFEN